MNLENVWIEAKVRLSCYGISKWPVKKPTFCVEILDSIEHAMQKWHYWLKWPCILGKWQTTKLGMKLSWCEWYGYRVIEWKYI